MLLCKHVGGPTEQPSCFQENNNNNNTNKIIRINQYIVGLIKLI